jgi:hypothetical protein
MRKLEAQMRKLEVLESRWEEEKDGEEGQAIN